MHSIKQRQRVFWEWADCQLHSRSQDGVFGDGIQVDVQVRTSREGKVQLFVGGYDTNGVMVFEEYYKERPGETMTVALNWGCMRGERLAVQLPRSTVSAVPFEDDTATAHRRGPL